jgi:hypothetical protein
MTPLTEGGFKLATQHYTILLPNAPLSPVALTHYDHVFISD